MRKKRKKLTTNLLRRSGYEGQEARRARRKRKAQRKRKEISNLTFEISDKEKKDARRNGKKED